MTQHYIESVIRKDPMAHKDMAIDSVHYLKVDCTDSLMSSMYCVTEWDTGRVKETLTGDMFAQNYVAVDMATDPDQKATGTTNVPIVTSPNGSQFEISVDNNGNIATTPVVT